MRLVACLGILVVLGFSVTLASAQLILPKPDADVIHDCTFCPPVVVLPNGLMMGQTPVTREEFKAFVEATGFQQLNWGCKWHATHIEQTDDHPVVCVSFNDATKYVDWLSQITGNRYRLPTVAEMRYAIMANQTGNYWWGQAIGENRANCVACKSPYDGKGTAPVKSFPANDFNIFDAVGNVWVWTTDCAEVGCSERRLIGGGWSSPPADLRTTKTIWNGANIPFNSYGIRVVREDPDDAS